MQTIGREAENDQTQTIEYQHLTKNFGFYIVSNKKPLVPNSAVLRMN